MVTSSLLGEVRHDGYILLDVQTGSSLLIRQNTANNLVSPDIFIGISVYRIYIQKYRPTPCLDAFQHKNLL